MCGKRASASSCRPRCDGALICFVTAAVVVALLLLPLVLLLALTFPAKLVATAGPVVGGLVWDRNVCFCNSLLLTWTSPLELLLKACRENMVDGWGRAFLWMWCGPLAIFEFSTTTIHSYYINFHTATVSEIVQARKSRSQYVPKQSASAIMYVVGGHGCVDRCDACAIRIEKVLCFKLVFTVEFNFCGCFS